MATSTTSAGASFFTKLEARCKAIDSLLCVGLDPHEKDIGAIEEDKRGEAVYQFCHKLIAATLSYTVCYKPNAAFFENFPGGIEILKRIIDEIHQSSTQGEPPALVLLDVKRGDIGSTAIAYAQACYDYLHADAVTLSPLMGYDSISPFVTGAYKQKFAFCLCKTSNPGSNELMTLSIKDSNETIYERIASLIGKDWHYKVIKNETNADNTTNRLGLVVGATDSIALSKVRSVIGDAVWILAPGVGAQGGDLKSALQAGLNSDGLGMLIPVSRGISRAEDPNVVAKELTEQINTVRKQILEEQQQKKQKMTTTESSTLLGYQTEFIKFSLSQGVLKFGSFTLKSGRISPYFFNAGLFASGKALHKLGKAYASAIMNSPKLIVDKKPIFDVIFGPAYKGIPLGAVVSSALYADFDIDIGFAYNRKEAKDHGEGGTLVGCSIENKKVLVVDDVITAGTAIRESYDLLSSIQGAQTVGVIIALDRAEKKSLDDPVSAVQAVERDMKVPVISIINLLQLQTFLINDSSNYGGEEVLQSVAKYREQYGCV